MSARSEPRVAVVGGGPRALWALERLATLARRHADEATVLAGVDVFTRDGVLGAGTAYEPLQPPWLRVNVRASVVDAWPDPGPDAGPSLDAWREARSPGSSSDAFPPRGLVGAYLHEQGRVVLEQLEARTEVRVARRDVTEVRRDGHGWRLDAQPGTVYDHVLLCTGHEEDWPGALRHHWPSDHPAPVHPQVFPVAGLLARPELERPAPLVVVRGAALTGLDAAVALTRTQPAARVVLVSRTGRPMHAKSSPAVVDAAIVAAGPALDDARRRVGSGDHVRDVLLDLACALTGGGERGARAIAAAVRRIEAPGEPAPDPRAELRTSIDVARGDHPPTGEWALAQAWRALHPRLVRRQAAGDPHDHLLGWPQARAWSRELERWAFGPPLVNAAALLRLLEDGSAEMLAGRVDEVARERGADLVVDAVLAPPGLRDVMPDSLLGRLRDHGVLSVARHGRGAVVDGDGSVPGAPGLALIGRATEDVVLGTDTLDRRLHDVPDRWARGVLGLAT